ncbi:PUA domain-containing protein, partial [Pantoea sp. SIMBA_079]|uniref:PUA domain-containing protein n=1 Tax=Pantoea sp. SIMBA_079 TaxID=3085817 RepID=UPI00399224FD
GGAVAAQGASRRGDLVEILLRDGDVTERVARGVTQYSADDIRRLARRHSRDIEAMLGYNYGENIVHRDDLVLV